MKSGNSGKLSKSSVIIIILILTASAAGYFKYFSPTSHEANENQIVDGQNTTSQVAATITNETDSKIDSQLQNTNAIGEEKQTNQTPDVEDSKTVVNNGSHKNTKILDENLSASKPPQKDRKVAAESEALVTQNKDTSSTESRSLKSVENKVIAPEEEKKISAVPIVEKVPLLPLPSLSEEQPKIANEPVPAKPTQENKISEKVVQPTTITIEQPQKSESYVVSPQNPKPKLIEQTFEKLKTPEFWFWLGLGENYQFHQQTIPSISGQAKFQNIQGPTLVPLFC